MKISIGLDISKKNIDLAIYDGEKYKTKKFNGNNNNVAKNILNYVKKNKYDITYCLFTMEITGTYHLIIADALFSEKCNISIVNPYKIKKFSEMEMIRAKTDKADAKLIAQYGYERKPSKYVYKNEINTKLMYLCKYIDDLIKEKTSFTNRLEAYTQSAC